jgi:type II secretory pathway component PulC
LKGATVDQVTLSGVFISKSEPSMSRAILLVPGLRAPVIASRGDALYDAVIKEIRPDSVVFTRVASANKTETAPATGEEIKKLRSTAGDKK